MAAVPPASWSRPCSNGRATWPSCWPSAATRRTGASRTSQELVGVAGEYDDVDRVPRDGGPGLRLRRAGRRRDPGVADDPAHGQGAGVPGGVPDRPGGRDLPPLPGAGRARGAGGGAPALLRGHHPGPPSVSTSPTPGSAPCGAAPRTTSRAGSWPRCRASSSGTSVWWGPASGWRSDPPGGRAGSTTTPRSGHGLRRRARGAVPGPPRPRGSTGAEVSASSRGRRWSTTTGGRAWCSRPRARGTRPRRRCVSARWARSACSSRPPRCGGPEPRPVWRPPAPSTPIIGPR